MGAAYGHNVLINSADQFAYFGLWSPAGGGSGAPTVDSSASPGPGVSPESEEVALPFTVP